MVFSVCVSSSIVTDSRTSLCFRLRIQWSQEFLTRGSGVNLTCNTLPGWWWPAPGWSPPGPWSSPAACFSQAGSAPRPLGHTSPPHPRSETWAPRKGDVNMKTWTTDDHYSNKKLFIERDQSSQLKCNGNQLSDLLLQESLEQLLTFFCQLVLHHLPDIFRCCCGNVHLGVWTVKLRENIPKRVKSGQMCTSAQTHSARCSSDNRIRLSREKRGTWSLARQFRPIRDAAKISLNSEPIKSEEDTSSRGTLPSACCSLFSSRKSTQVADNKYIKK